MYSFANSGRTIYFLQNRDRKNILKNRDSEQVVWASFPSRSSAVRLGLFSAFRVQFVCALQDFFSVTLLGGARARPSHKVYLKHESYISTKFT
jgi:hypothetical protein